MPDRDIVYCHQCENEWYRDEHGLTCPECQSDFTEIVEPDHDPRDDEGHIPGEPQPPAGAHELGGANDFYAPDPDEDDIDDLRWEETGPGRYRVRGTYTTTVGGQRGGAQSPTQGVGMGQGLMGLVGNVLQGIIGADPQQQQRQIGDPQRPMSPPGDPASAPDNNSQLQQHQQQQPGGTFVRHGHGAGFSWTIASSSNATMGGAGLGAPPQLFPRNAHAPQPFQANPDHIDQMLAQMFMNIGAMPGGGPPFPHPDEHGEMPSGFAGPFVFGGGPAGEGVGGMRGGPGMGPFANLLQMFGVPPSGVAGDAVYSQEALDRIITQLMEQHTSGHAPGPASESAIKALPTKTITTADFTDSAKAECSICMDEVPLGASVTVLPCGHWFHFECIEAWLSEHDTCPHCRQGIMPKDGPGEGAGAGPAPEQPRSPSQPPLHDMHSPEYARPSGMEGAAFPFPRRGSGGGGGGESAGGRRRSGGSSSRAPGMFSRMRDAFSGGGSGDAGADGAAGAGPGSGSRS